MINLKYHTIQYANQQIRVFENFSKKILTNFIINKYLQEFTINFKIIFFYNKIYKKYLRIL